MISSDPDFEAFLDLLYAAPAEGNWYDVAETLGRVVGLDHVTLVRRHARTGLGLRAQTGFHYGDFEFIRDRYVTEANAYVEALAAQPRQLAETLRRVPPEEHGYRTLDGHLRDSFGVAPEFGAILGVDGEHQEFLSIMKPADLDAIDGAVRARFLEVLPHLRRSVRTALTFERRAPQALGFEAAFHVLSAPAFLCAADGRVLEMNPAAERLVARYDGVRLARGVLAFSDRAAGRIARAELDRAASRAPGDRMGFPARRRAGALPLSVTVVGQARGVAIVFVEDPDRDMAPDVETLSRLAGLSHAQARAARLAAQGLGTDALAAALGVSPNTARTHLRRAFHKLDCANRRELALRLAALRGATD